METVIRTPEEEIKHLKAQIELMKKSHKSSLEDMRVSQEFPRVLQRERNSLIYWEKQIVLFSKWNYGEPNIVNLKFLVSQQYSLPVEQVNHANIIKSLSRIHNKLLVLGLLSFELSGFIENMFRYSKIQHNPTYDDVIMQLLIEISGHDVTSDNDYSLDLGEIDTDLYERIVSNTIDSL